MLRTNAGRSPLKNAGTPSFYHMSFTISLTISTEFSYVAFCSLKSIILVRIIHKGFEVNIEANPALKEIQTVAME